MGSFFQVTDGQWTDAGQGSGEGSNTLTWSTGNSIAFTTDPQSNSALEVAPGGKLIIGQFTINASFTSENEDPFVANLKISVRVEDKNYPLDVGIELSSTNGVIRASLGSVVPFSVFFDLFSIKILGLSLTRNTTAYLGAVDVSPGTSTTVFLFAEIVETPASPPVGSSTSPAFNDKECLIDSLPEGPGIPEEPIIPDPLPPEPILPICEIPDPPLPPPIPPLPPIVPVPPGPPPSPPSPGCIPQIQVKNICRENCDGPPIEIEARPYGQCNYLLFVYENCCHDSSGDLCCDWHCCDGDWVKKGGNPTGNTCCGKGEEGNPSNCEGPLYHVIANLDGENASGCEDPDVAVPECWYVAAYEVCEGDDTCSVIYEGCGDEGGEDLVVQLETLLINSNGPIEGAYDEAGIPDDCTADRIDGPAECLEAGETTSTTTSPAACDSPPDCPCECEGQVITVCDCEETTTPPPGCNESQCEWQSVRISSDPDAFEWVLVTPCEDESTCCCPYPADSPTLSSPNVVVDCTDNGDDACTTLPPCETGQCVFESVSGSGGFSWELVTDDCSSISEAQCCCPDPASLDPPTGGGDTTETPCDTSCDDPCPSFACQWIAKSDPISGDLYWDFDGGECGFDSGDDCCCPAPDNPPTNSGEIEETNCTDNGDARCTTTEPPLICCLVCDANDGKGETFDDREPELCVAGSIYEDCPPLGCCDGHGLAGVDDENWYEECCDAAGGTWTEGPCPVDTCSCDCCPPDRTFKISGFAGIYTDGDGNTVVINGPVLGTADQDCANGCCVTLQVNETVNGGPALPGFPGGPVGSNRVNSYTFCLKDDSACPECVVEVSGPFGTIEIGTSDLSGCSGTYDLGDTGACAVSNPDVQDMVIELQQEDCNNC